MSTIRERVLERLAQTPEDCQDAGEVFYYVGGRSWMTFCREVYRMEREGLVESEPIIVEEEWYIRLPDTPAPTTGNGEGQ